MLTDILQVTPRSCINIERGVFVMCAKIRFNKGYSAANENGFAKCPNEIAAGRHPPTQGKLSLLLRRRRT